MGDNAIQTRASGEELAGHKPQSIDDELVGIREKLKERAKPKRFDLPGYGPRLQVEYKLIEYDEINEIGDKVTEQIRSEQIDDSVLAGLSDTLVRACVRFYKEVEVEGEKKVVPLEEAYGLEGGPVRWGDQRLWDLLRLEAAPGETLRVRAAMRQILGDDKLLVLEHAQEVTRWMERVRGQVDTDF